MVVDATWIRRKWNFLTLPDVVVIVSDYNTVAHS